MIDKKQWKTINVKPKTKEALEKCKVHPNQSFDEILQIILEVNKND